MTGKEEGCDLELENEGKRVRLKKKQELCCKASTNIAGSTRKRTINSNNSPNNK